MSFAFKQPLVQPIESCRVCGNRDLIPFLDLGNQALTGIFPDSIEADPSKAPIELLKCSKHDQHACGLVQLAHNYDLAKLYGDGYGYQSSLNSTMVTHLKSKVRKILDFVDLNQQDLIIDIGSNDGTTLSAYPTGEYQLVGVDPSGSKFLDRYPAGSRLVADFFSLDTVREKVGDQQAKVITSFSMFYDLPDPMQFIVDIKQLLARDGVWVLEQSYLPKMIDMNSFDTVCHEHLEYYSLSQIHWMLERSGCKIVDIEFNNINGGSFSLVVSRSDAPYAECSSLSCHLNLEEQNGMNDIGTFHAFSHRVEALRDEVQEYFLQAKQSSKRIGGLGASTKGNVLLQYCGLSRKDIHVIGDVNPDKFGSYSPGSLIPIIPEKELLEQNFDAHFVLPWHFRNFFLSAFRSSGKTLVFPLPKLEQIIVR